MGKILVKEKEIVLPGQVLAEGMDYLPSRGTFREKEEIISYHIGSFRLDGRLVKVIPLRGAYIPKKNDMVIGKIVDVTSGGWRVDIGYAFMAGISLKDGSRDFIPDGANLREYHEEGDIIVGKIWNIKGPKLIDISMTHPGSRKLIGGKIIKVDTTRVPRVIGKEGSMITMIKDETGCNITVGQNGLVWISGPTSKNENEATQAILKVNDEAATDGLTEKIKKFLGKGK